MSTAVADIFATTYLLLYNYVYSCSRYTRYNSTYYYGCEVVANILATTLLTTIRSQLYAIYSLQRQLLLGL